MQARLTALLAVALVACAPRQGRRVRGEEPPPGWGEVDVASTKPAMDEQAKVARPAGEPPPPPPVVDAPLPPTQPPPAAPAEPPPPAFEELTPSENRAVSHVRDEEPPEHGPEPPELVVRYDEFKNQTTIRQALPIKREGAWPFNGPLEAFFFAIWEGRVCCTKGQMLLVFEAETPSWVFLRSYDVDLLVDGAPLHFRQVDRDGDVHTGGIFERVLAVASRKDLARMLKAKTIRGQVGPARFALDEVGMKALQAFETAARAGSKPPATE